MTLVFDHPSALWIAAVVLPMAALSWWMLRGTTVVRRVLIIGARAVLVLALAIILANPAIEHSHDDVTVIGVMDVSESVRSFGRMPAENGAVTTGIIERMRQWLRTASGQRQPNDRVGLVIFDGRATTIAAPTRGAIVDAERSRLESTGTNIEDAIRLAVALFPSDTARRLVLMTDGNETTGRAIEAARHAVGIDGRPIPIDVLPLPYRAIQDVQIERLDVPPAARPGQAITVRIVVNATHPTRGRLGLRREATPIDLNGDEPGTDRMITVPAGTSIHRTTVLLGEEPVNRLRATFVPDDEAIDVIATNNQAESVVATPGKGRTLLVTTRDDADGNWLAGVLRDAELQVDVRTPAALPEDPLSLQNFDLVILDDVSAGEVAPIAQELLARHVTELGAGLLMVGGSGSFGAGGWMGTPIADVLPLELDPPPDVILPEAALVLVLDRSGSMRQRVAGALATQQQVANHAAVRAIESLRENSLVGVISFNRRGSVVVPLQQNLDREATAQRVLAIEADGGTSIVAGMRAAYEMLKDVDVERKRVVCLTDGRDELDEDGTQLLALSRAMQADGIGVSTIGVGDDSDFDLLNAVATAGGGEFFPVLNPRSLPRVMVDSVQIVNTPLIKEGRFVPRRIATGSTMTAALLDTPPLDGLVVTAPRADARATIELEHPDGEPLLAHWQAGLGEVAAFTSDAGGAWSSAWSTQESVATFWVTLARRLERATLNPGAELQVTLEGDEIRVSYEATNEADGFVDYLQVPGRIYGPGGQTTEIKLDQVAAGRYEARLDAPEAGSYVVALAPRRGRRQMPGVIGAVTRSTGDELRRYEPNHALLQSIATESGGRVLDPALPRGTDLFDRADLSPTIALRSIGPLLLLAGIGLFLADVTVRRLAWRRMPAVPQTQPRRDRTTADHLRERRAARHAAPAPESAAAPARSAQDVLRNLSRNPSAPLPDEQTPKPAPPSAKPTAPRDQDAEITAEAVRRALGRQRPGDQDRG